MKKSIRFISVFIALTLIALSLPVSFACPPPFDELDAEIQNRQRMSDRICPSEIKTDKYTFKYSTAGGEKTRIECDDGGTGSISFSLAMAFEDVPEDTRLWKPERAPQLLKMRYSALRRMILMSITLLGNCPTEI